MTSPAERSDAGDLVLDVSLSCAWCFADEASEASWAILSRLQTAEAHVPSLWLWETANVLVQAERRGRITAAAIRSFLGLLEALPIHTDHAGTTTIWHDTLALARAHRLTSTTRPISSWPCVWVCPWPAAIRPCRLPPEAKACRCCRRDGQASQHRHPRLPTADAHPSVAQPAGCRETSGRAPAKETPAPPWLTPCRPLAGSLGLSHGTHHRRPSGAAVP